ncbi:MAG: SPOR domain-containing protein [Bacteroidales bacterium]
MRGRILINNFLPAGYLRLLPRFSLYFALMLALFLLPGVLNAQDEPEYDEINVYVEIKGAGGLEMPAVIKGETLFLPVTDLFDFLRIRNTPTQGLDSISGFFINPDAKFYISRHSNNIIYQERVYRLSAGDLVKTESNLYLKADQFGRIFGLDCSFSFRNLSVLITSKLELPVIREMKLDEMRKNITRLKGEIKADTTIGLERHAFRFGMADWSVISSQEIKGKSDARLNLNLGAMVLGGEATVGLNYNSRYGFREKQQNYQWRYVNNDFAPLRQVSLGKLSTQATSTIFNPVVGVQFTNTPTTFRRSFGTYTLSDKTEPGWIVELYVNNVLVDYVKADASGFFTFQVPLVYGNTIVKLKFYGPWGEEKTREQSINIPFNFLPEKTFEYTVSGGFVEDTSMSRFARASLNYGVTRGLTVGAGVEYLSSVSSGPAMPFVRASLKVTNNLLLLGEYTHGVRLKGNLTYRLPSNIQLDLSYALYDKNQTAIKYNYREERKLSASVPVKIGSFSSYNRLSVNQLILPSSQYTTGEWLFSSSLWGINTNLTTYGLFIGNIKPYFYSNLSAAFRLPARFVLMPQLQYSYSQNQLLSAKLRLEKSMMERAFLFTSYERNFRNNLNMAELGFKYDFDFARTGMSVQHSSGYTTLVEHASGSLINDSKTRFIFGDNRPNVGRGGITLLAYIDANGNGKRDAGEMKAAGLGVRVNSGRLINSERDTIIRIIGLEPYTSCYIELDQNSLENISWRLPFKTISVMVDPNILKTIEIPIIVAGEASGTVTVEDNGKRRGQGRMIVNLYSSNNRHSARTLTEDDGYFSFFGMKPGNYYVSIDRNQLYKLRMIVKPDSIPFNVKGGTEGDIIEGLDFTITLLKPDTTGKVKPVTGEVRKTPEPVRKDSTMMIVHELVEELVTISEDSYDIQLGAFKQRKNAENLKRKLEQLFGNKVEIVVADDFFKVRIKEIRTREEVDQKIEVLRKNGFNEIWIVRLKAKQQQRVLIEKQDTVFTIFDVRDSITGQPVPKPLMSVQVGAFRNKEYAQTLTKKLSAMVKNPVEVIFEGGYYKVRVTGFNTRADIERVLPSLGIMGFKDLWVPPVKTPDLVPVKKPVQQQPVVTKDTLVKEVPAVKPVKDMNVAIEPKPEIAKPVVKEPPIALKVGEFLKKSQVQRAQRRIRSELGLEPEIMEQWGYYYIIIRGFNTREETYRYYPELAMLGYSKISIVEIK